jgi:hypothetical protein
MLDTPVLFLVFNRPEHTLKVFEQIRVQKPKHLFIAADGPRHDKEGEKEKCNEVRKITTTIDWECQIHTLFRDTNLGCGKAVSEAITWFFNNVEQGIILEDDCLPENSFFSFCEELLERYKNDKRIMSISGTNQLENCSVKNNSYFLGLGGIWGWASWKRAWLLYDKSMAGWQNDSIKEEIKKTISNDGLYKYYQPMFQSAFTNKIDTWDIQWFYSILINKSLSIQPCVNLVKNIGFGDSGTHTFDATDVQSNNKTSSMHFPLKHPLKLELDKSYLNKLYTVISGRKKGNAKQKLITKLKFLLFKK